MFVAAQQFGNVAALGRLGQEVQPLERALPHGGAVLLKHRVLDEHAAPFGEQAQCVVELGYLDLLTVRRGAQLCQQ
ncbi:MAG: hypothetical protein EBZ51_13250, partial [Synechococcaceae bacterium WB9_2_112]|nr:hypothetical protein [Synechococcaceae bacterium WB9_2_112]